MKRAPTAALIAVATLAAALTGCGTKDPLDVSCAEFIRKDAATQLSLASRWGAPNRDQVGPAERIAGSAYKEDLLRYCPTHPTDKLSELEMRLSPF